jgi:hypothetical protein
MEYVKFFLDVKYGDYTSRKASNIEMTILGHFLATDAGNRPSSFREWFFDDSTPDASSNLTSLTREDGYVLLSDLYSEEDNPTELKMTYAQFLKILDDWEEKVIKAKPKEVLIKYENDEFTIETKK